LLRLLESFDWEIPEQLRENLLNLIEKGKILYALPSSFDGGSQDFIAYCDRQYDALANLPDPSPQTPPLQGKALFSKLGKACKSDGIDIAIMPAYARYLENNPDFS
jgi:hypothetical protein